MRIYGTQAQMQAAADKAHAYLISNNEAYAQSVSDGKTTQWAIPARQRGANGDPVGDWHIPVEPSCLGAFNEAELALLDKEGQDFLAAQEP